MDLQKKNNIFKYIFSKLALFTQTLHRIQHKRKLQCIVINRTTLSSRIFYLKEYVYVCFVQQRELQDAFKLFARLREAPLMITIFQITYCSQHAFWNVKFSFQSLSVCYVDFMLFTCFKKNRYDSLFYGIELKNNNNNNK